MNAQTREERLQELAKQDRSDVYHMALERSRQILAGILQEESTNPPVDNPLPSESPP